MALAGTGAICIWNDVTDEGRDAFYAWHLNEHIPERVAIPGFLSGRRYIACGTGTAPEFFTLYETLTPAVLTGSDYLARLNVPTAWTTTVTQAFRNTARALTEVQFSCGPGLGGILATIRVAFQDDAERTEFTRRSREMLPSLAALPHITGAHLCLTDLSGSRVQTAESRDRTDIQAAPDGVIMIEGCTTRLVEAAAKQCADALGRDLGQPPVIGLYRLEHLRTSPQASDQTREPI